jgi:integrase
MAILQELGPGRPEELIFPARRGEFADKALLDVAKELHPHTSIHGFRSAFRDWAAVQTAYARDVIELALAHKIKSATEAAYWRDDALEKRHRLMEEWGRYCASPQASGQVVALR